MSGRWLAGILALGALCACGGGDFVEPVPEPSPEPEPYVLSLATAANWDSANTTHGIVFQECARLLREWSGDTMRIDLYDNERAGGDWVLGAGVQLGSLSIVNFASSSQVDMVPETALFGSPGLVTSPELFNAVMAGDYGDTTRRRFNEAGLELLACFATDHRILLSDMPVRTAADLEGMRIRTLNNEYDRVFWETLGTQVEFIDFGELYIALQNDEIDAMENPLAVFMVNNLTNLRKHITFTNHSVLVNFYVMNREQYTAVPDEYRALLHRFIDLLEQETIARINQDNERLIATLEASYQVEFSRPSEDLRDELRLAGKSVEAALRERLGEAAVDDFLNAMEAARQESAAAGLE